MGARKPALKSDAVLWGARGAGKTAARQAALAGAKFYGLHDRKHPANAAMNVYRSADDTWFVLLVTPDKLAALAQAIDRADLLKDSRFSTAEGLVANMPQLAAILDEVFAAQPMAHWYEAFNGAHVTFGAVPLSVPCCGPTTIV